MSHKWTRGCASIQRLQNGSFDFEKAFIIEEGTQCLDNGSTLAEGLACIRIHCQVSITLPRAQFRVFQGRVTDDCAIFKRFILGSGQRADGFGKHAEVVDMKCSFASFGTKHHSFRLNKITDVKHLIEEVEAFFSNFVGTKKKLNFAVTIFNMRK